jgi:hypothetical protein
MIRIPGVIGMHLQEALIVLQQAGLNPIVKRKQRVMKEYAGMECTVVSQLPLPGGVAMFGASVTISLYMPTGACQGQAENGQWSDELPYEEDPGQFPEGEIWGEESYSDQWDEEETEIPQEDESGLEEGSGFEQPASGSIQKPRKPNWLQPIPGLKR